MKDSVLSLLPLVILAIILNGCGIDGKSTEDYLARARDYHAQGDAKTAIIELKNALRRSPDNAEARTLLGSIYVEAGDAESAEKELLRAVELGVAPQKVVIPLLRAQLVQGKFQEVLDFNFEKNTLEDANQATLLVLRGNAQLGLGELDLAREAFDEAMALQPDSAEAGLGHARIAAASGDPVTARKYLDKAIKTHDDFALAWSLLGDIDQFEGNMVAAEAHYSKALEHRPGNVYDLANRALTRIAQNKLPGAASDVAAAASGNAQQSRKQPLVIYAQGQLNFARKEFEEAVKFFNDTLELVPGFLPARFFLAVSQYHLGSYEQAELTLGPYRNKAPQYVAGHKLFAAIKVSQGKYDVAQTELENILSFDPDDAWVLDLLVEIAEGNPEQSTENYRKTVELQPDPDTARMNLSLSLMMSGTIESEKVLGEPVAAENASPQTKMLLIASYLMAKRWDEAIEAGKNVVSQDSGNWDAYRLMGGAYLGKEDSEKAREMFQQALKLNPGNPSAASNLARLELKTGNEAAARSLYEQVLERHPYETSAILSLGALDSRQGKFQDAIARIEVGLKKKPQDLSLRVALARLYLRTGQPTFGIDLVLAAPKEQADNPLLLQLLGDSQFALGNFEAAAVTYEKLVSLAPESTTAHELLARTHAELKQFDRAEKHYKK